MSLEGIKVQLQEMLKPFFQEQNYRQKQLDLLKNCMRSVEKNDFFQLDELLRSKLAQEIEEDSNFSGCESLFDELRQYVNEKIDDYYVELRGTLLRLAEECDLSLEVDLPRFSVLKGIEGKLDFSNRRTTINQVTLKTIDPRRIISTALKIKCQLYANIFDPQKFIDSLLHCYKKILSEVGSGKGDVVPILRLYNEYVWSLQSNAFFLNMDKGKFRGYSIDQFSVDLWRFFQSEVSSAEGGYRIRLNSGRGKTLWLIDPDGERRQITHASFVQN